MGHVELTDGDYGADMIRCCGGEYAPETIALWMLAVVPEGVASE